LAILGFLLLVLAFDSLVGREGQETRAILNRLLSERADRPRVQAELSPGVALTKEDARRVARMMAIDKSSTLSKIDRYPSTYHHCVTASVTCFVFYDDQGRMVDYELGVQ